VAKEVSVSLYELTAAGLFGILTQFPFNLCIREPFAVAKLVRKTISANKKITFSRLALHKHLFNKNLSKNKNSQTYT
jgi:hypothetical protein